jgi:acyl-CoA synthetase (AMP-forming)/AMP-acid ligase II
MATQEEITLLGILEDVTSTSPESPCCVLQDNDPKEVKILSYEGVLDCLKLHQSWLRSIIEDFVGDQVCDDRVVAFLSSNSVDMLLSMLACTATSLRPTIAALLNIRWTADEMAKSLQSEGRRNATTIVLYGPGFEAMATQVVAQLGHKSCCLPIPKVSSEYARPLGRIVRPSSLNSIETSSHSLTTRSVSEMIQHTTAKGSDCDAMIVFTSGTTGGSKGVRLSHRALAVQSLAKLDKPCNYATETVMLASTVPLFHVGGLSSCLAVLFAGGSLVFPRPSKNQRGVVVGFDPNLVKQSLESPFLPVNTLVVVPAMLVSLFGTVEPSRTYPAVRLILIGGQSASDATIQKISQRFPNARIVQTYACTEAASSLTFLHVNSKLGLEEGSPKKARMPNGDCVGSPPHHVDLRLYRKDHGKATKIVSLPYAAGIIATKGPHLMSGYWQRGLAAHGQKTNRSGWYLTSDLGFFDDAGQLYFCGRTKDVIRSGGETVMAQEVERALLKHPDISECAVFPRQDERFGEAVACALVVVSTPLRLGTVTDWCRGQGLATYKRPRYLFMVDSLPRNSSGKVLKHELIDMFGRIQRSKL